VTVDVIQMIVNDKENDEICTMQYQLYINRNRYDDDQIGAVEC
jgi:hypothetical protein